MDGASLVVQVVRICLLLQGNRFDPWARKIPHAMGAAAAQASPSTEAQALEPMSHTTGARA